MADTRKIYWDSCVWIGLINSEPDKIDVCNWVMETARNKEATIWTSSLTLAEVFKKKCGPSTVGIDPSRDSDFESYIEQNHLFEVQVDHEIGVIARRLLRAHPELKKPMDAIHLATAVVHNLDEFHTFDAANLLALNGKVMRADGKPLHILTPQLPTGYQPSIPLELPEEAIEQATQAIVESALQPDASAPQDGVA